MKVGVLALQGAFAAHVSALEAVGVAAFEVRKPSELDMADRLVIPGGESTTISMMLERSGLERPVAQWVAAGRPVLGTCAGAILLARSVSDGRGDQLNFGALDMSVRRNAFGRQRESFEADLEVAGVPGGAFHAVFIRAPRIESVGESVEVLATISGSPALVRSGPVMASTFHPELAADPRIHELFCTARDEGSTPDRGSAPDQN